MSNTGKSPAAVRVCAIADIQCSRDCGTGPCKRETSTVEQHEAAPAKPDAFELARRAVAKDMQGFNARMEAISKKRDAPSAPLEGTGNGADALIKRLCVLRGKLRDDVGAWEVVRDAIDALSRTPRTEVAGAVQEGWKLVPHIPTKEMIEAGCEQWHWIGTTTDAWQAMFCAAPDAPTED